MPGPARFRVTGRLGHGGMAEVLLAETPNGTRVVVKRVLPHLADEPEFLARFAREARLSMRLVHPNIVKVLATGADGGLPYIVMEWLDGSDLRALLARGPVPPAAVCLITARVARALAFAHELRASDGKPLRIVHRDVSPHNVIVTRAGEVKLVDFGIAKSALFLDATRTGKAHGKVAYMAPEQLAGLAVDARADLFALGIVTWEMLSGRRLWKRDTDTGTARAVRDESALPPSTAAGGLPPELDALVLALLSKFPAGRPSAAAPVAARFDALAAALGSRAPEAELAALVR